MYYGLLEVKGKVTGNLFLQFRTQIILSFPVIPNLTIYEHLQGRANTIFSIQGPLEVKRKVAGDLMLQI